MYTHLTPQERYQIEQGLQQGLSAGQIAKRLGRHRSTVYREINRGRGRHRRYVQWRAQARAERRARRSAANHPIKPASLWRLIERLIRREWSPAQIQGYLERFDHARASSPAIYAHIRRHRRRLWACLRYGQRRYPWGRHTRHRDPQRPSIDDRPASVQHRRVMGHWEGDTLMGRQGSPHRVLCLVERTSRYVRLVKPDPWRLSASIASSTVALLKDLPLCSITFDNGTEFSRYRQIMQGLACPVYFAHPHSPWERATCENTIGLIRQYLPKGSSLADLTQAQLQRIERKLNSRPRLHSGFKTPNEVLLAADPPVALRT